VDLRLVSCNWLPCLWVPLRSLRVWWALGRHVIIEPGQVIAQVVRVVHEANERFTMGCAR
jgi:hypothetical protein